MEKHKTTVIMVAIFMAVLAAVPQQQGARAAQNCSIVGSTLTCHGGQGGHSATFSGGGGGHESCTIGVECTNSGGGQGGQFTTTTVTTVGGFGGHCSAPCTTVEGGSGRHVK